MADTEVWQRGPIAGVADVLQPVAHILLQVGESVDELTDGLTEEEWNARPAGAASAAFHVRHMAGVIERLFTYARGESLPDAQIASKNAEGDHLALADAPGAIAALHRRVDAAVDELRQVDVTTLGDYRA